MNRSPIRYGLGFALVCIWAAVAVRFASRTPATAIDDVLLPHDEAANHPEEYELISNYGQAFVDASYTIAKSNRERNGEQRVRAAAERLKPQPITPGSLPNYVGYVRAKEARKASLYFNHENQILMVHEGDSIANFRTAGATGTTVRLVAHSFDTVITIIE